MKVKERIDSSIGGHGKPFDAILMDFVMPNMDGPTATRQLRTMGYTGVIFGVTGNGKQPGILLVCDSIRQDSKVSFVLLILIWHSDFALIILLRFKCSIRLISYSISLCLLLCSGLPSDIDYFLSCGANKVLLKPLDLETFGQAIEQTVMI